MKGQFFIISAVAIASILIMLPMYLDPEQVRFESIDNEINTFKNIKKESKNLTCEDLNILKEILKEELKIRENVLKLNYTNCSGTIFIKLDLYSQNIELHDEYQGKST